MRAAGVGVRAELLGDVLDGTLHDPSRIVRIGRRNLGGEVDHDAGGLDQRRGIAADPLAGGILLRGRIRVAVDIAPPGCVPLVRKSRGQLHHPRLLGCDQDRDPARPVIGWHEDAVFCLVMLPLEGDLAIAEQRPDDRHRFLEHADPMRERDSERLELRLMPAQPTPRMIR